MLHGFDNPTLIVSQVILTVIYTVVFYLIHRGYPQIKGIRYFVWAFLLASFARPFFVLDGIFGQPILGAFGNCFALTTQVLIYKGLLETFSDRGVPRFASTG